MCDLVWWLYNWWAFIYWLRVCVYIDLCSCLLCWVVWDVCYFGLCVRLTIICFDLVRCFEVIVDYVCFAWFIDVRLLGCLDIDVCGMLVATCFEKRLRVWLLGLFVVWVWFWFVYLVFAVWLFTWLRLFGLSDLLSFGWCYSVCFRA